MDKKGDGDDGYIVDEKAIIELLYIEVYWEILWILL